MQSIQQQFSSNLRFILWNNRYESDAIDLIIILLESRIYSLEQSMWIRCNRSNNNSPRISDLSFGTIDVNRSNNNFPRISDLSFGTIDVNPIQSIQQQFSLNLGFILWNNRCESIQQRFSSNLGFIFWNNRCESDAIDPATIFLESRIYPLEQSMWIDPTTILLESLIYGKKKRKGRILRCQVDIDEASRDPLGRGEVKGVDGGGNVSPPVPNRSFSSL